MKHFQRSINLMIQEKSIFETCQLVTSIQISLIPNSQEFCPNIPLFHRQGLRDTRSQQ